MVESLVESQAAGFGQCHIQLRNQAVVVAVGVVQ